MDPKQAGAQGVRVPVYPILSVTFIGSLSFSIVFPFLVFLVTRWGGNALVYGFMGATYSVFQLIGAPVMGRWSDLYGRRRVLLLTQLGTLASWLLFLVAFFLPVRALFTVDSPLLGTFALTLPLLLLFLARAADGITGGNISVANAYMADITSDAERSANFGKMAMASNLGFVLGPAIAGVLGGTRYGEMVPVLAAVAISAVASGIIAFRLPEPERCEEAEDRDGDQVRKVFGHEPRACVSPQHSGRAPLRQILGIPYISTLLAIYFLVMLGFNFFYIAFPIHAAISLRWTVIEIGVFFSVLSLLMVLVQGPLLARVSRRVGDLTLILLGSPILAASFLLLARPDLWSIYGGAALLALGNGLMWPSVMSVLSRVAGATYQGAVQGIAGSVGALASILGLIAGGLLYETLGGSVFFLAGATIFVVFLLTAARMPAMRRLQPPPA